MFPPDYQEDLGGVTLKAIKPKYLEMSLKCLLRSQAKKSALKYFLPGHNKARR